jgi:hypothetical protein
MKAIRTGQGKEHRLGVSCLKHTRQRSKCVLVLNALGQ